MDEEQKPPNQNENMPVGESQAEPNEVDQSQPQDQPQQTIDEQKTPEVKQPQETPSPEEKPADQKSDQEKKDQEQSASPQDKKPEMQQPHLLKTQEGEKKAASVPKKSFIIAIVTIGVTIAVAVGIALYLGSLTKKELKSEIEEKPIKPQVTRFPQRPTVMPTVKESSPAGQEKSETFEALLELQDSKDATSSESIPATQEATLQ